MTSQCIRRRFNHSRLSQVLRNTQSQTGYWNWRTHQQHAVFWSVGSYPQWRDTQSMCGQECESKMLIRYRWIASRSQRHLWHDLSLLFRVWHCVHYVLALSPTTRHFLWRFNGLPHTYRDYSILGSCCISTLHFVVRNTSFIVYHDNQTLHFVVRNTYFIVYHDNQTL